MTKYNVSVHAIFREETRYIKEWLEYHLMIGVDHFYLFCDDDLDESRRIYDKILAPYHKSGIVDIEYVANDPRFPRDMSFQIRPLVYLLGQPIETKWLIVLDLDEFIFASNSFLGPNGNLHDILSRYEKPEIKGLHIPVATFGSSGLLEPPALQTESFIMRGKDSTFANWTAKNFYRPEMIKNQFLSKEKSAAHNGMFNTSFQPDPPGKHIRPSGLLRVNHYATRSLKDWTWKVQRGNPFVRSKHDWDVKFARYNVNLVEDRSMETYLPELKKRLGLC